MTDLKNTSDIPDELSGADGKKRQLFDRQKALLDTFLGTGAITPAQYRKSLTCLAEKMGFPLPGPLPE